MGRLKEISWPGRGRVVGERCCSIGRTVIAGHRLDRQLGFVEILVVGRLRLARQGCRLASGLRVLRTLLLSSILELLLDLVDFLGELVKVLLLVAGHFERFAFHVLGVASEIHQTLVTHSSRICDRYESCDDLLYKMIAHF